MIAKNTSQEMAPSEPKPRKTDEQIKSIETDDQLDLDLHTAADLDAILIALFN